MLKFKRDIAGNLVYRINFKKVNFLATRQSDNQTLNSRQNFFFYILLFTLGLRSLIPKNSRIKKKGRLPIELCTDYIGKLGARCVNRCFFSKTHEQNILAGLFLRQTLSVAKFFKYQYCHLVFLCDFKPSKQKTASCGSIPKVSLLC